MAQKYEHNVGFLNEVSLCLCARTVPIVLYSALTMLIGELDMCMHVNSCCGPSDYSLTQWQFQAFCQFCFDSFSPS